MLANTTIEVAGVMYEIDENGYVTVAGDSIVEALINSGIEKHGIPYGSDSEKNDNYVGDEGKVLRKDYYSCSI